MPDIPSRPWPDEWMIPSRANVDEALSIVWGRDPNAAYFTDLKTKMPLVTTRRHGVERQVPFMPGFVWSKTAERSGWDLVQALKL